MKTKTAFRSLFHTVSSDRTEWLFVVRPDDGWTITRNGAEVAVGTSRASSIKAGVETFLMMTHSPVEVQVDRIIAACGGESQLGMPDK